MSILLHALSILTLTITCVKSKSATRSVIELGELSTAMDKDFVLLIEQEKPYGMRACRCLLDNLPCTGSRAVIERFVDAESKFGTKSMALQVR